MTKRNKIIFISLLFSFVLGSSLCMPETQNVIAKAKTVIKYDKSDLEKAKQLEYKNEKLKADISKLDKKIDNLKKELKKYK